MRRLVCAAGVAAFFLAALPACRPDQIQHLKDSKRIGIEAENWVVKRIMPADLLHATRWAGDSLTLSADRELHRLLAERLAQGGVAAALPYCRPETYASTDSLAHVLKATAQRVSNKPRNPQHQPATQLVASQNDTMRNIARPSAEVFTYQRPIVLDDALCLRCHGEVGKDIAAADYALIKKAYPTDQAIGYQRGAVVGAWQVRFARNGVAEFYTMKTRKVPKPHKLF
ncbi:DUF3365 domain-containing protein [Hymenobacter sp. BT491]|uniref:c-type heme family protein n=1 Tax=Hymenobacter sp. BT491 TaxID=2766779 RepID=UPI00165364B5|nr:DUF3365 domain-containing protein [Hymenobacter sp. BT491]MBC6991859.1 DUF3365 domain-containing protein [Hymenobacter sp. BT491]